MGAPPAAAGGKQSVGKPSETPYRQWNYYSAFVQNIMVSFVCFGCPGMFNALTGMGGGGLPAACTSVGATTNSLLYAFFAVFGLLGGAILNLIGPRLCLFLGGLTYLWYIGSMLIASSSNQGYLDQYCTLPDGTPIPATDPLYTQYSCGTCHANSAAPYSGGALLGIGAGILWTAQGAIMMAYPTENRKGTYISIFWIIFNLGGVIGSIIPFALNFSSTSSGVSTGTYAAFMVLMGLGSLLGLALAPPSKVIKEDSTHVVIDPVQNVFKEFLEVFKLFTNIDMLIMLPMFFTSNFFYSYQFDHFNGYLFNTRTKAFNNIFYWGAQMIAAYILGNLILDNPKMSRRKRGFVGWAVVFGFTMLAWILGLVIQLQYPQTYTNGVSNPPPASACPGTTEAAGAGIDFTCSSQAGFPIFTYFLMGAVDAFFQNYSYWIMGTLSDDATVLGRFAGYYKGIQSAGGAVAWALSANHIAPMSQLIVNWVLAAVGLGLALLLVRRITEAGGKYGRDEGADGVVGDANAYSLAKESGGTLGMAQDWKNEADYGSHGLDNDQVNYVPAASHGTVTSANPEAATGGAAPAFQVNTTANMPNAQGFVQPATQVVTQVAN